MFPALPTFVLTHATFEWPQINKITLCCCWQWPCHEKLFARKRCAELRPIWRLFVAPHTHTFCVVATRSLKRETSGALSAEGAKTSQSPSPPRRTSTEALHTDAACARHCTELQRRSDTHLGTARARKTQPARSSQAVSWHTSSAKLGSCRFVGRVWHGSGHDGAPAGAGEHVAGRGQLCRGLGGAGASAPRVRPGMPVHSGLRVRACTDAVGMPIFTYHLVQDMHHILRSIEVPPIISSGGSQGSDSGNSWRCGLA